LCGVERGIAAGQVRALRGIGPHPPVQADPLTRPQRYLAVRFADVDDDGESVFQCGPLLAYA
jgi:hypothetical protein